jgi:glyoxylase-like metal-dependent hydrolase (beta-lactamase superfamily II)
VIVQAITVHAGIPRLPARQPPGYFRLDAAGVGLLAISDGFLVNEAPFYAPGVAPDDMADSLRRHGHREDAILVPTAALIVDTGRHLVVVDPGSGPPNRPDADGALPATEGRFMEGFDAAGLDVAEVDLVIVTHGHYDHFGGVTDGHGQLRFPNAEIAMSEREFVHWRDSGSFGAGTVPEAVERLCRQVGRTSAEAIADRVRFVQDGEEVVAGIRAISTPGHTIGHISLEIGDGPDALLVVGDAIAHHYLALEHPGQHLIADYDPRLAIASRRALLERAARERLLVQGFHFPLPSFGRITRAGDRFAWEPVMWAEDPGAPV